MSVSSVNSGNSYAAQDYSEEGDKTNEQIDRPPQESTLPSSSDGSGDAQAPANSETQQSDSPGTTESSESASVPPSSSDGSSDAQASVNSETQQSDSSRTTGSSESANVLPSSRSDSDAHTAGSYGTEQANASGTTGISASGNTQLPPGGSGGDMQTSGDHGNQQGNRSGTMDSTAPGSTSAALSTIGGNVRVPQGNGIRQRDYFGSQSNRPEGTSFPAMSTSGGYDEKIESTSPASSGSGDSQAPADYSNQQSDTSGKTERLLPAITSPAPLSTVGHDQIRENHGNQQREASAKTGSSMLGNTLPASSGSGDTQTSGDYGSQQGNRSATPGSPVAGDTSPASSGSADSQPPADYNRQDGKSLPFTGRGDGYENTAPAMRSPASGIALAYSSGSANGTQNSEDYGAQKVNCTEAARSQAPGLIVQQPSRDTVGIAQMPRSHGIQQTNYLESAEASWSAHPGNVDGHDRLPGQFGIQQGNPFGQERDMPQAYRFRPTSDVDGGEQQSAPSPTSRSKRDDAEIPEGWNDDYANYVLRLGEQSPLSQTQLDNTRRGVVNAVAASHSRLADPNTADMIGNTVLDALNRSPTFRSLVSYSLSHGGDRLDDVMYTNSYVYNSHFRGENRAIPDMTLDYLRHYAAGNMPILADASSAERYNGEGPIVNIGVAPNEGSPNLPGWQESLFHELVHELTHSDDPPADLDENHMGPTEILAYRVMHDLGLSLPDFPGYASQARDTYFDGIERGALLEAAERNAGQERNFFQRLDTIRERGDGAGNIRVDGSRDASPDFRELEAPTPGAVANNHTYAQPVPQPHVLNHSYAMDPQGDLSQMEFHNGTVSLFPFAHSAPDGAPSGYQSAYAASSGSWDTQGRFFQYGKPVDGNPHMREFDFQDGSKVVASAHEPQPAMSDLSKFNQGMTVVGGALAGGLSGAFVGGPVGLVVGGGAGAAGGAAIASAYPYDRIWQGYTLDYYNKGETKPFYTQYMYAWDGSAYRVGRLTQQKDASLWPDYGDGNPDGNWQWWKWKSGNAPLRT